MAFNFFETLSGFTEDDFILPQTSVLLLINGVDFSGNLVSYTMSGARGQPITGSITLKDITPNRLAKRVPAFNQANQDVKAHNMTDSVVIDLVVSQGGITTQYPDLIPGDPSWDNDGQLTWKVSDMTALLNLDNQSIDDIMYDEGDDETAHSVLAMLTALSTVSINPTFTDYNIRTFRMSGSNLLSAIDELLVPRQAYRKWEGSTLKFQTLTETGVSDSVVDRKHISSLSVSRDTSSLRTFFRAYRDAPQATALCSPVDCTGGECVGRVVELTFAYPTIVARIRSTARHGVIGEGVFFDEDEEPLNETPATEFYGTPTRKAVRWLGTYTPEFGELAYVPYWRVTAEGGVLNPEEIDDFKFQIAVPEAEALYGRRPETSNLATELIRDPETMEQMLDAVANEVLWSINKADLSTPFLLDAREGDFISVTHFRHSLDDEPCLVDNWNHAFSWARGWNNNYGLCYKI